MGDSRGALAFVVLVYLLVYLLPLGGRPMFVPDEGRYAEIPREMMAGGDFVVPRLDGLRYFEKPVMGYWVNAAAFMALGVNRFALRLPSALAAGLSGLLVFLLLRRTGPRSAGGLPSLGAAVFLTCLEVVAVGTFAVLDSLLALFLTAGAVAFFLATEAAPGSGRERTGLVLAGTAWGLAFLTKGFLALAVPVVVFVPYLVWEKRARDLLRLPWIPLAAAFAVALPWSLAVARREPGFWPYFFWVEHVRRFFADNAQHGRPFWYYLAALPLAALPWSFAVPAAAAGLGPRLAARDVRGRTARFALCWFGGPLLFFSAAHGKLLTYILPCFPPLAVAVALGIDEGGRRVGRLLSRGGLGLGLLFAGLLAVFLWAQFHGIDGYHPYGRTWKWLLAADSLAFFAVVAVMAGRARDPGRGAWFMVLAPLAFFTAVHFILPDLTLEKKAPGALLARHRGEVAPDTLVVSGEEPLTMVCFVFARDDVFVLGGPGELAHGLSYPDAAGRRLDPARAAVMIRANPGRAVLVARARNYRRWRPFLPQPRLVDDNGSEGYVFVRY